MRINQSFDKSYSASETDSTGMDVNSEHAENMAKLEGIMEKILCLENKIRHEQFQVYAKYQNELLKCQSEIKKVISPDIQEPAPITITNVGVSHFWLTAMQNHPEINDSICERDEPVLKHLVDVRSYFILSKDEVPEYVKQVYPSCDETGILLEFEFSENKYFKNHILHKYYKVSNEFSLEDICQGVNVKALDFTCSTIDWYPDQKTTVQYIFKKQKNKRTGDIRKVRIEEPVESFFTFFEDPKQLEGIKIDSEEYQSIMHSDFMFASVFHNQLIPHAVLYYHGKVQDGLVDLDEYDVNDFDSDDSDLNELNAYDDDDEDDEDDDDDDI